MNVFLSHIKEEAQVASVLARWIESSFDRDVHVSCEPDSAQLGEQQLAAIDRALGEAQVVLLLCSLRSIGRSWISFEAGCAWARKVHVVAVCHSGCSASDMLPPLGTFQALDLTDAASCQAMLETVAGHLQRKRMPRVDCNLMVAELRAAIGPVAAHPANAPVSAPASAAAAPAPPAAPQSLELRLLLTMQRLADYTCTAPSLAERLGEQERKVRDALDKLVLDQLITPRASMNPADPDTRYALADKGRSYLARHRR